jgi:hypothetical protein
MKLTLPGIDKPPLYSVGVSDRPINQMLTQFLRNPLSFVRLRGLSCKATCLTAVSRMSYPYHRIPGVLRAACLAIGDIGPYCLYPCSLPLVSY